jgi:toxin secretion/phage lysis holin
MDFLNFKNVVLGALGITGGVIATALGGWDSGLQALVIFMAIDFITGLIVAGVFHTSPKSESGAISSKASREGLSRKGTMLLIVLVGCQLDTITQNDFIRDSVIIGFVANELISIVENAAAMGIPMPKVLTNAIEFLKQKQDEFIDKVEKKGEDNE